MSPQFTHASPSQVQTFRDCPRKWWLSKIAGIKEPTSAAQELGTQVHEFLERHLRGGSVGSSGGLAREIAVFGIGSGMLPLPGSVEVEGQVAIPGAPLDFVGIIDYIDLGADPPVVGDHKTSSSKRWVKTPAELAENVQMVCYGHYALAKTGADSVVLRHHYYGTKGRRWSETVEVRVTSEAIKARWAAVCTTVDRMQATALLPEADVEQVLTSCSMYGGCFYRDQCFGGGLAVPAYGKKKTGEDAMTQGVMKSASDVRSQLGLGDYIAQGAVASDEPPLPPAVNPPTDPGIRLGSNGPERQAEGKKPRRTQKEIETDRAYAEEHGVSERTATKRRLAEEVALLRELVEGATEPPEAPASAVPLAAESTRYLFIGCVPLKGAHALDFTEVVAPIQERVARQLGAPHVAGIDFGKGYAQVAVQLSQEPWPAGVRAIYIDPMSVYAKGCLDIMIAKADFVVRKV